MVRALFIHQVIGRRHAVLALGELLQQRLVVAARIARGGRLDLRAEIRQDEFARRLHAAVQIDRRDQRLQHVRQHRRRHRRVRRHSFAQHEELAQAQRLADLRARLPADDDRLELRQVAFQLIGKLLEQLLADDQAQDRVAEKLQPLVRRQPVVGARGVGQRRVEQLRIAEPIAEPLLAALQPQGIVGIGSRQWRLNHDHYSVFTRRPAVVEQNAPWQLRSEESRSRRVETRTWSH